MKADLTRNTFDPLKHFTRVLMQQGRVQLDSDWNEQAAILLHHLRTLAADLIGKAGGPGGDGFTISDSLPVAGDFRIGLGHYYVDGVLCEADAETIEVVVTGDQDILVDQWTLDGRAFEAGQLVEISDDIAPLSQPAFDATVALIKNADQKNKTLKLQGAPAPAKLRQATNPCLRRVITYLTQPDYPAPDKFPTNTPTSYLVYLDAWERHLTWIEDNSIREVALGGPDTASRARLVWQVKLLEGGFKSCDPRGFGDAEKTLVGELLKADRGRLKAMAKKTSTSTDPCIISPDANYQGPENQLYRVEIHSPGIAKPDSGPAASAASVATFKWSRENGSVAYPIVGPISTGSGTTTVTLANLGRDDRYGLSEGDWVEIQDDDYMLLNQAGNLLQVQTIDRGSMRVTLAGTADPKVGTDPAKHPLLRRWEQKQGDPAEGGLTLAKNGTAIIEEHDDDMWLELEDGVKIQFQPAAEGRTNEYRTGDFWLIPARTATGDVEWPSETITNVQGNSVTLPLARRPLGIKHHYAALGVINLASNGKITVAKDDQHTCRKQYKPLADN